MFPPLWPTAVGGGYRFALCPSVLPFVRLSGYPVRFKMFVSCITPNGQKLAMSMTPDLLFLHIHNPFTNEMIRHGHMSLDTTNYFVNQISHMSKGVVIVASA